ncbi:MAG: hypothetical protein H2058_05155 [Muricauda sp.]|nr:hypothetical protein [Allomuricauda sp.]MBA4744624.1 hypothetical protein [Allomuricauda sp.]
MSKGFIGFFIFLLIVSCNKADEPTQGFEPNLLGSWSKTYEQEQGIIINNYTFNVNSTFKRRIEWFGFNGAPKTELTESSEYTGTFEVEGDSLFFRNLEGQGGFNSKFWIKNNVLHLEYITYPADAPVLTQIKYEKID